MVVVVSSAWNKFRFYGGYFDLPLLLIVVACLLLFIFFSRGLRINPVRYFKGILPHLPVLFYGHCCPLPYVTRTKIDDGKTHAFNNCNCYNNDNGNDGDNNE